MARKQKSEKEIVVSSGAAAAVPRRKTAASRTKHSSPQAEMPAPSVDVSTFPPAFPAVEPTFDQVARLAYSYWVERGYQGGSSEEDWLRAERELRSGVAVLTA
jgi:hypothetical protein